jgi:hypothetical protein
VYYILAETSEENTDGGDKRKIAFAPDWMIAVAIHVQSKASLIKRFNSPWSVLGGSNRDHCSGRTSKTMGIFRKGAVEPSDKEKCVTENRHREYSPVIFTQTLPQTESKSSAMTTLSFHLPGWNPNAFSPG